MQIKTSESESESESTISPVGPRTTDVTHPGVSTLISAPQSNQLGNQARYVPIFPKTLLYFCW